MPLATPVQQSWVPWFAIWQWPFGNGGVRRSICLFATVVLLGLLTYGALYWFSLSYRTTTGIHTLAGTKRTQVQPAYAKRFQLPPSSRYFIRLFFKPAHQIDHWIRPGLWAPHVELLTPEEREKYLARRDAQETEKNPARAGQVVGGKLE